MMKSIPIATLIVATAACTEAATAPAGNETATEVDVETALFVRVQIENLTSPGQTLETGEVRRIIPEDPSQPFADYRDYDVAWRRP